MLGAIVSHKARSESTRTSMSTSSPSSRLRANACSEVAERRQREATHLVEGVRIPSDAAFSDASAEAVTCDSVCFIDERDIKIFQRYQIQGRRKPSALTIRVDRPGCLTSLPLHLVERVQDTGPCTGCQHRP